MSNIEFSDTKMSIEQPQIVEGAIEELKKKQAKKEVPKIDVQPPLKNGSSVSLPMPEKTISAEDVEKVADMLDGMEEDLRKQQVSFKNAQRMANANNEAEANTKTFAGSLEALFEALLVIFKLTRESRQLSAEQRRTSQLLNINIIKEQAASLRNAANWQVGVAVLSGMVAAVSLGTGVFNVKNSLGTMKKTKETSEKMEIAQGKLKQWEADLKNDKSYDPQQWPTANQQQMAIKNKKRVEKRMDETKKNMEEYQKDLEESAMQSRSQDTMAYAASSVSQALSSAVSSMGGAASATSQAEVKELDAKSTETQINTEVSREKTASNDGLLGDIVSAFRTLAESLVSALRQGTNYV